jgi:GNAT superfamily N-acetyltransferase
VSNEHAGPAGYSWVYDTSAIDWEELSGLYRIAPLGDKPPDALATVFGNSMFTCFAYADGALAGAGRALADGLDCAYIADVAVHPAHQGRGLGTAIIRQLVAHCEGHKKNILYANPGTEPFYARLGFLHMNTAMAIWHDPARAIESGLLGTALCPAPRPRRPPPPDQPRPLGNAIQHYQTVCSAGQAGLPQADSDDPDLSWQRQVAEAFVAAARRGDVDALVTLLDPEVVLRAGGGASAATPQ